MKLRRRPKVERDAEPWTGARLESVARRVRYKPGHVLTVSAGGKPDSFVLKHVMPVRERDTGLMNTLTTAAGVVIRPGSTEREVLGALLHLVLDAEMHEAAECFLVLEDGAWARPFDPHDDAKRHPRVPNPKLPAR